MKVRLPLMNKNRLIFLSVIAVFVISTIAVLTYKDSFYSVELKDPNNVQVSLYKKDDNKKATITTIASSRAISLQKDTYCAVPSDSKYVSTPICFNIDGKGASVTIDPDYSSVYLGQILPSEQATINTVITTKYAPIISQYTLLNGQLYGKGQWYGATLTEIVDPQDRGDVYRVLLENINGTWTIIAYPQLVLSKYSYPQVPFSILDSINQMLGVY
jgi:hypothetical protein